MSIKIIPAYPEHAPLISGLIYDMLDLFLAGAPKQVQLGFFERYLSAEALAVCLKDNEHDYFVMKNSLNNIIGVIGFHKGRHIRHLFVARHQHGKGYARQLWTYGSRRMMEKYPSSAAFTVNASIYAVPAYRAFGFEGCDDGICNAQGIQYLPMVLAAH